MSHADESKDTQQKKAGWIVDVPNHVCWKREKKYSLAVV